VSISIIYVAVFWLTITVTLMYKIKFANTLKIGKYDVFNELYFRVKYKYCFNQIRRQII